MFAVTELSGRARAYRGRFPTRHSHEGRAPMISEATTMITPHPSVVALMQRHTLGLSVVHDDLQASTCACRARAVSEGTVCAVCGGLMVRTGTCHTCTQCGTTGGCG